MAKARHYIIKPGYERLAIHCPACDDEHHVRVNAEGNIGWDWNGSVDEPTLSPSLLSQGIHPRCHCFVRGGRIEFLGDCEHSMAGQTVELPPIK